MLFQSTRQKIHILEARSTGGDNELYKLSWRIDYVSRTNLGWVIPYSLLSLYQIVHWEDTTSLQALSLLLSWSKNFKADHSAHYHYD